MEINQFVKLSIQEDVRQGDHSTLSCIPKDSIGSAKLIVKENGLFLELIWLKKYLIAMIQLLISKVF